MKFGRNVLHVNTEPDFRSDVIISKMVSMTSFHTGMSKSADTW